MKTRKSKDWYYKRAKEDFKQLVIYYSCVRPQHSDGYKRDGEFSKEKLIHQMKFLEEWNTKTASEKKALAKKYAEYSRTFNYVFGMPSELVTKVMGEYIDESGKRHAVSSAVIIDQLIKEGFLKVMNAGRKFKKNESGAWEVKCWWYKKYMLANRKYWFMLLGDERYTDIKKMPKASPRLKKIVFNWIKQVCHKENEETKTAKVETHSEVKIVPPQAPEVKGFFVRGGFRSKQYLWVLSKLFGVKDEVIRNAYKKWVEGGSKEYDDSTTVDEKIDMWVRLRELAKDEGHRTIIDKMINGFTK